MKEKLSSVFLDHMVEAFADISDFVRGQSLETFRENKLVSYATARALLIVGEASSKVRVEVRERFPEIPWQVMSAMRNRSVHNYIGTSWSIVWNVATVEVPALTETLKSVRDQLNAEEAQQKPETPG